MPLHTAQPAPSREADSWSGGQEIDRLLGTITSIAVFSDLNSQPAFPCSVPLRSTVTPSFHLCLGLASALLIIILYPFLLPPSVLHILQSHLTFAQLFNKIFGNFYSPKAHCHVFKSTPLIVILSQMNPVHDIPSYFRSVLILLSRIRPSLPSSYFPSGFPTQNFVCISHLSHA